MMKYYALATDYDGTLATRGRLTPEAKETLQRFRHSGRKIILVTGRPLEDLLNLIDDLELFDRMVAENGALLYNPATKEERILGEPVPQELIDEIKRRNLPDFHIGRAIINAWEPHQKELLDIINDLGLEWHLIFNKGNVMVLPSGVNKASGIKAALAEVGLSHHNIVGIGDAENDHHFLRVSEVSVAVANALPSVKAHVDLVMEESEGAGVVELMEAILDDELDHYDLNLSRHNIHLGKEANGQEVSIPPFGLNVMAVGEPGSGKTTLARHFMGQLYEKDYQFCAFDPEGDYVDTEIAVPLGNEDQAPSVNTVVNFLEKTDQNCIVNLLAVPYKDRPLFFRQIFTSLQELRKDKGRPHWIILDETYHLLPVERSSQDGKIPDPAEGLFLVTPALKEIAPSILADVDLFLMAGRISDEVLEHLPREVSQANKLIGERPQGQISAWWNRANEKPFFFQSPPPDGDHPRHKRKYARAHLPEIDRFEFRGPENRLNLTAGNLLRFVELAQGVDDDTWQYHLKKGDVTRWFKDVIKDPELVEASQKARQEASTPDESRAMIKEAIEDRYTGPI